MRNSVILVVFFLILLPLVVRGQDSLYMSLRDCVRYGLEHASAIRKAELEREKTQYQIQEGKSKALPQIRARADLNYHFARPITIGPGALIGLDDREALIRYDKAIEGTLGLGLDQMLWDPALSAGKAAREQIREVNTQRIRKNREEVALEIAKTYYQALIARRKGGLLNANLTRIEGLLTLTRQQYENGFAKEIDVKRLEIAQRNLETELGNLELRYEQLLEVLRYRMAMPFDQDIALRDSLPEEDYELPASVLESAPLEKRPEISLLQTRNQLSRIELDRLEAERLPSLHLRGQLLLSAQGDNPDEWISTDFWYGASFLGLRLKYDIFDGHRQRAKANQARVALEIAEEDLQFTRQSLDLQYRSSRQDLRVNYNKLQSLRTNREEAKAIYRVIQQQYEQGITPIMELLSAETAMREAQTNYITTLLQTKLAELELRYARGELLEWLL